MGNVILKYDMKVHGFLRRSNFVFSFIRIILIFIFYKLHLKYTHELSSQQTITLVGSLEHFLNVYQPLCFRKHMPLSPQQGDEAVWHGGLSQAPHRRRAVGRHTTDTYGLLERSPLVSHRGTGLLTSRNVGSWDPKGCSDIASQPPGMSPAWCRDAVPGWNCVDTSECLLELETLSWPSFHSCIFFALILFTE